jgi:large subunit ribosomal protein L17
MRHQVKTKKFKASRSKQDMLFRNLASSLILHERIQTTQPKAKELSRYIDRLITVAKKGTLESKRSVAALLTEPTAATKVRKDIVTRYKDRTSGFTRIAKIGLRKGDASKMVKIELV